MRLGLEKTNGGSERRLASYCYFVHWLVFSVALLRNIERWG